MKYLLFISLIILAACKPEVKNTGHYEEHLAKAEQFAKADQIDSALRYFHQAAQIDSGKFEVLYGLGFCFAKLCTEQGQHCNEAMHYLNKAEPLNTTHKSIHYHLFMVNLKQGNHNEAMLEINKCIGLDSSVADYYRGRASLCLAMQDTSCACQNMQFAMDKGDKYINQTMSKYCKDRKY